MKQVLVFCNGNSCRSQIAEGYFHFYGKNLAQYQSAGLDSSEMHPFTIQVMEEDNIDISTQQLVKVDTLKEQRFDYLISMGDEMALPSFIQMDQHIHLAVPDPTALAGSEEEMLEEFRRVREMIKAGILKFIGQELIPQKEENGIKESEEIFNSSLSTT